MENKPNTRYIRFLKITLIAAISALSMCLQASQVNNITSQIYSLLAEKQYDEAYAIALEQLTEWEGNTEFDLAFGLAAKSSGNCSTALFSLERVVQMVPQSVPGRFALANCYLALKNFSAAATEFNVLDMMQLSPLTRESVEQTLAYLKRNQTLAEGGWTNSLRLGVGADSNPNNGVEDEFIDVPILGQVRLFEQSRETSSALYQMGGQFSYLKPLTQHSLWYAGIGGSITDYADDIALSQTNFNVVAGYKTQFDNTDMDVKGFYRPLRLDSDSYLNYYGFSAQASLPVMQQYRLGGVLTLATLDYVDLDELTRNQLRLEIWIEAPTFNGVSRLTLLYGDEQSDLSVYEFNSRQLTGLTYAYSSTIDGRWSYILSADYFRANYAKTHPLFLQKRDDKLFKLAATVNYQYQNNWLLNGQIKVLDNSSNISLYQYDRGSLWLGATYQF